MINTIHKYSKLLENSNSISQEERSEILQDMVIEMINLFKRKRHRIVKTYYPTPGFEFKIIFRKEAVKDIMKVKGWKTYSEMARALGFTRQYISLLANQQASVTATVITRLASLMGSVNGHWWEFYELVPYGLYDANHNIWNHEKHKGTMPYAKYSLSAQFRSLDHKVETTKE